MKYEAEIGMYKEGIKAVDILLKNFSGYIAYLEEDVIIKNLTHLEFLKKLREGQKSHLEDFVKAEAHVRTGKALGFEEKGLIPGMIYSDLEEHGISQEKYKKTHDSVIVKMAQEDPMIEKLLSGCL